MNIKHIMLLTSFCFITPMHAIHPELYYEFRKAEKYIGIISLAIGGVWNAKNYVKNAGGLYPALSFIVLGAGLLLHDYRMNLIERKFRNNPPDVINLKDYYFPTRNKMNSFWVNSFETNKIASIYEQIVINDENYYQKSELNGTYYLIYGHLYNELGNLILPQKN